MPSGVFIFFLHYRGVIFFSSNLRDVLYACRIHVLHSVVIWNSGGYFQSLSIQLFSCAFDNLVGFHGNSAFRMYYDFRGNTRLSTARKSSFLSPYSFSSLVSMSSNPKYPMSFCASPSPIPLVRALVFDNIGYETPYQPPFQELLSIFLHRYFRETPLLWSVPLAHI